MGMNPDPQSWADGGIPDNVKFHQFAIPYLCFTRALDERLFAATKSHYVDIDRFKYFYPIGMDGPMQTILIVLSILDNLGELAPYFVKPDKISTAENYEDCFWTREEIRHEVGEDLWPASESSLNAFLPDWPVRYIKPSYEAINLLRYLPTTRKEDWPDEFDYEDKNDTFKFKAP